MTAKDRFGSHDRCGEEEIILSSLAFHSSGHSSFAAVIDIDRTYDRITDDILKEPGPLMPHPDKPLGNVSGSVINGGCILS